MFAVYMSNLILRAHNCQNEKSTFPSCPCHKVGAVGLSVNKYNHAVKSWLFVSMSFLASISFIKCILSITASFKFESKNLFGVLHM